MVRECGDEGRWVVVLSNRLPSRRRRSLRPLGLALALVAASLAASAFVDTARADDPAPASGGAATNTPAAAPDPTPSTDPPAAPTEPPPVSADTQSAATNPATPPPDPPAAPTDPPAAPTDPPAAPTDPPAAPTDPPVTSTDPPAAPSDPPVTSTDPPAAESKTADIAPASNATTDPPTASTDPSPAPTPPNGDVSTGVGSPQVTGPERVTIVPLPMTAAKLRAVVPRSWLDDCRFSVLCGAALLARSPFESAQALFNSSSLSDASSTQPGTRSGGDRDRTEGAQTPKAPIPPPAPNHQPDGPTAPGAFFGFSSSGGFHNGGLLALMAVLLGFTFLQSTRRVTPPEQRVHGPLLVLSLERPG
jgi:hypothetical protein